MKNVLVLLGFLLAQASLSRAFTLCYLWEDEFRQPGGSSLAGQLSASGTRWESVGPAGVGITVQPGNLAVTGLSAPQGNRVRLAGTNGPGARVAFGTNVSTGTLYYSLALRVTDRGTLGPNGGVLAALNDATGASQTVPAPLAARLLVRSSGGGYQLGLSKSTTNTANFVWASPTFSTNDVVFVVVAYEFTDPAADAAHLWINPPIATFGQSNAPPPTLTTSAGADVTNLQSFVLLQRPQPILPAVAFVDEVRVANLWAAAAPPPTIDLQTTLMTRPTDELHEGAVLPITATVSNAGPDIATSAQLSFNVPVGVVLQSVTNDHGGCTVQGDNVTCTVATLAPQQSFNVMAVLAADSSVASQGSVESFDANLEFSVRAAETDSNPANNRAIVTLTVFPSNIHPNPVAVFGGFEHVASGNAAVSLSTNGLILSGLASTNDVVRVNLSRVNGWRGEISSFWWWDDWWVSARGAIGSQSNQPLNSIRFERAGSNGLVSVDFSGVGASQYQTEFYDRNGVLLASRAPQGFGAKLITMPCIGGDGSPGFKVCQVAVFADAIYFLVCGDCMTFEGGPGPIQGPITVKVSAVGASLRADYLSQLEIGGAGASALTLVSEAFHQGDFWHQFLGNAVLEAWPDDWEMPWFRAGNLGASGQDGVKTELSGADALDVTLEPVELKTAGRRFRVQADGQAGEVNGTLATLELAGDGNASQVSVDVALIPLWWELSMWNGAQRTVEHVSISSGAGVALTPDSNGPVVLQYFGVFKDQENHLVMELEFAQPLMVTVAGGASAPASRIRFTTAAVIEHLGSVLQTWRGADVAGLLFTSRDYGDAPLGYPVTKLEGGASHRYAATWRLGSCWDRELNGMHSTSADYDDTHGAFGLPIGCIDDEDGVAFLTTTGGILVQVTAAHDGFVDAWMDFNRDLDWSDGGEQVIASAALTAGVPKDFTITAPVWATAGEFVSRWRFSETGGLLSTGYGGKGEVEDHVCQWEPEGQRFDFGDAPDSYQTYLASGGPSHVVSGGIHLGATIDAESDGQPVDLDGPDEDGVTFPASLAPGAMAMINVTASVAGKLDAWIDFNHSGVFDAGLGFPEAVCVAVPLVAGANLVPINVPAGAIVGGTWARFRFSLAGGLAPGGAAPDGEVEDYGPGVVVVSGNNPNPVDLVLNANRTNLLGTENQIILPLVTLTASNRGPLTATSVQLVASLPAGLRATAATNSSGGSCQITSSNVTCAVASLASNRAFTVELTLRPNFLSPNSDVLVTLSDFNAAVRSAEVEARATDNSLSLPVSVRAQTDWGDARGGFPVTPVENGPYHRYSTNAPWLGSRWDNDDTGNHSLFADFDDRFTAGDDEDGVAILSPIVPGMTATAIVTCANAAGFLDAWADFNGNTNWADRGEQIFARRSLAVGANTLTFTVPADAAIGPITTRWRVSTTGGLGYTGYGGIGEVEDHMMTNEPPQGADLRVALPDAPIEAEIVGEFFRFTASAANAGSNTASNVSLVVTFEGPAVAEITAASSSNACQVVNGEIHCAVSRLTAGQSAAFDFTATPEMAGRLTIRARVDFGGLEIAPFDNVAARVFGIVSRVPECACTCFSNTVPSWGALLESWFTKYSGRYARILPQTAATPITVWSAGPTDPTPRVSNQYADVQKIQYYGNFAYITAYGLASHVMGPWYCDPANRFPTWPGAQTKPFQIPLVPDLGACTNTGFDAIGLWVNGTAIYSMLDGHYYDASFEPNGSGNAPPLGDYSVDRMSGAFGSWNRDAWFAEAATFDYGQFHTAVDQYHSHTGPSLLRLQLSDNVTASTNVDGVITVTEATGAPHHSPILGWAFDGHPIYGPYGYSDPGDTNSVVRRMVSGYVPRDGTRGTVDVRASLGLPFVSKRTTLPTWARRASGHPTGGSGPSTYRADDATACNSIPFSLGRYAEDNAFLGHLINPDDGDWYHQGEDFDLDLHNGRCCVTPEYPNGTYAYFVTLNETNGPAFPYVLGWEYCGARLGGENATVNTNAETYFVANAARFATKETAAALREVALNRPVTLRWDGQEGKVYRLFTSENLQTWTPISLGLPSDGTTTSFSYLPGTVGHTNRYFKVMEQNNGGQP